MKNEFVTWLNDELNRRGWSNSELARRANVVPSTVSMILTQEKEPSPETCVGIARAFGIAPERVFRLVGILPPIIIGNDIEKEKQDLLDHFQYLKKEDRDTVRLIVQTLYDQRAEYMVNKKKSED